MALGKRLKQRDFGCDQSRSAFDTIRRTNPPLTRWRLAIARADPNADPRWSVAARGDAAAAIGIAINTLKSVDLTAPAIDLVMTAVLYCSLGRNAQKPDAAAQVLLAAALRRRSRQAPRCGDLEFSWLVTDLAADGKTTVSRVPTPSRAPEVTARTTIRSSLK